ncbi:MAG: Fe-S cluster assembly protein SufD [Betaproteobacteria bacterium RIFCSPLOWO2_02_FULL_67_26]|nr:MAG: Fe-S cluster assembly protein SufD [Betaproteobacteria bacterium RIFCSPLOWO2_02_FULL_67_26]
MVSVAAKHPYIEALLKGYEAPRSGASWLDERRAQALERANALTVPTTRDEEWRFTDITPLTRLSFRPAAETKPLALSGLSRFIAPEAGARLVFVDGVFAPGLSATTGLPRGVVVSTLAAALDAHAGAIEPHLARHAEFEREVFTALNTAHLRDGAFIRVGRNCACPAPVQLLHVSTQKEAAAYPRCLVIAEDGSDCTLIEDYAGLGDAAYFNDAVTEVVVGAGARVRHARVQREAAGAFHIATCAVTLARDARYASHAVTLGARLSRFNLIVTQQGEGAEVQMDGLALISGRQLADTHTLMDHAQPHGRCRQLHKCIAGGAAHAVFNGKILVRPGAQLTDSSQQSRNLLLSDKAHVDTKPQLEIFADDVKCAHGATVGQLDAEQLFYLRSRGLSEGRARNLLTYAFAAEVVDRIPVPSLVAQLEETVLAQTQAAEPA